MELYSKIKLVRYGSNLDKPLAYHIGYVMRVGGTKEHPYADVYYKQRGKIRLIRIWRHTHDNLYRYFDNDNNTILYYHSTLSITISPKSWVNKPAYSGLHYEIDKITEQEQITNYQFVGKREKYTISFIDDNVLKDKEDKEEVDRLMKRTKSMMYAHIVLGGFNSSKADQLFKKLAEGYDPYLISQFLPKFTIEELRQLYCIQDLKNDCIKKQDYENAVSIRNVERTLLDYHRSKLLASKKVINVGELLNNNIITEMNNIINELSEAINYKHED